MIAPGGARVRDPAAVAALVALGVALVLGGSRQRPLLTMAVELAALAPLVALVLTADAARIAAIRPAAIAAAVAGVVLLVETVPLPYPLWTALPGRALAAGTMTAAGLPPRAMPVSLDPYATVDTMLALLPGLALFAAGLAVGRRDLARLCALVVLAALASVALGAVQLAWGADAYPYPETQVGNAVGLFANRNQQVDLLLVAILLTAALARGGRRRLPAAGAIGAVLVAGIVAAGSRTGLALLAPTLLAALAIAVGSRVRPVALAATAAIAVAAIAALLVLNPVAGHLLDRYGNAGGDLRFPIWRDTLFAIGQYWPVGSGLGTFVTVYQTVETLDALAPAIINHAHDDYLELVLELGIGGVVLILGYLAALGTAVVRHARCGGAGVAAAGIGTMVLLAHALVDYPLRMPALMAVFGLLNAIVFRPPAEAR